MNQIAVRVENLSKQYHIGTLDKHATFREILVDSFTAPFRRVRSKLQGCNGPVPEAEDTIWALRDISFEIKRGEIVGIIGRNGAGKSTLLKILSRITEPTLGFAEIHGRVGSLLEVGTGFHGELSGRENIYLNGAILGMRKSEIARKFDEIVAFAEVEKFIDTPVKRDSSGMYLRLAFAVAAHLEPDILIVDEVLAVGDASFQAKCLGKMEDVRRHGRTVLFVSHNMPAITRLCQRAILLDGGRTIADAPAHQVVRTYLESGIGLTARREWPDPAKAPGGSIVRLTTLRARAENCGAAETMDIRYPIALEMQYEVIESGYVLSSFYELYNEEGIEIFSVVDRDPVWHRRPRPAGRYQSTAWIPGNLLSEGTISVSAGIATQNPLATDLVYETNVIAFQVCDPAEGDSARGDWAGQWGGVIRPLLKWETQYDPERLENAAQTQQNRSSSTAKLY